MATMNHHSPHRQHHHPQHQQMESPGQAYFDLDGDKELHVNKSSCDENDVPLTWRGDPSETLSDWTIVIVTDELQTISYHVHKNVLCFGPRHSKYFSRLILNQQPSSHKKSRSNKGGSTTTATTSKVELDQREAYNFPILLDYMYAPCSYMSCNGTVVTSASTASTASFITSPSLLTAPSGDDSLVLEEICFENAVSLRQMARQFEIESLMLAVNRFIQRDLDFKTAPKYLIQASEYKDGRLLESAQRLCADNFEELDIKGLVKLPLHIFRDLIRSLEHENYEEEQDDSLSNFASEVVCRYLEKHPNALSAELLLDLTDSLLMPCIASEAAIGFTALIKGIGPDDAGMHWNALVELSRRCARSVVQEYGWNDFSVTAAVDEYLGNAQAGPAQQVSRTDSLLFATSFAAALEQAQDDYEHVVVEQEQLEIMVNTLFESVSLLERSNQKKDDHLLKQEKAIHDAKNQILKLKKQVGEIKKNHMKRLPAVPVQPPLEISLDSHLKELVSPSQMVSGGLHRNKSQKIKELRTKNEMRARSLM